MEWRQKVLEWSEDRSELEWNGDRSGNGMGADFTEECWNRVRTEAGEWNGTYFTGVLEWNGDGVGLYPNLIPPVQFHIDECPILPPLLPPSLPLLPPPLHILLRSQIQTAHVQIIQSRLNFLVKMNPRDHPTARTRGPNILPPGGLLMVHPLYIVMRLRFLHGGSVGGPNKVFVVLCLLTS